jgi:hypothetical protein
MRFTTPPELEFKKCQLRGKNYWKFEAQARAAAP